MLYIKKGHEPEALIQAKREGLKHYDDMTTEVKDIVKDSLFKEQGGLCAYCMRRMKPVTMQIEHYLPQSISDDATTIDYANMLGVCPGNKPPRGERMPQCNLTCDQHRNNATLTINPLLPHSVALIKYQKNGIIYSDDATVNKDLNDTLNLNCKAALLPENRKRALETLMNTIYRDYKDKTAPQPYYQRLYSVLSQGKNGILDEYLGILLNYLVKRGAVPPHK